MINIRRPLTIAASVACVGLLTSAASAQHAGYTLLGDPESGSRVSTGPAKNRFVHPINNATYAEDSFVTNDVRFIYSYGHIDGDSTLVGGAIQQYEIQLRGAITDQLQIMLYKAGYMDIDSDAANGFGGTYHESGGLDTAVGLKWNFLANWQEQLHMAVGVGYEFPIGSPVVFQNDDEIRFWYSINKGWGPLHAGATINYILPIGDDDEIPFGNAQQLIWNLHVDYYFCPEFSAVAEVNGFHRLDSDDLFGDQGGDLFNVAGGDELFTIGAGGEYRPIDNFGIRAAVEVPVGSGDDEIFDWRLNLGFVISM